MANARKSGSTTIQLGQVKTAIALYKAVGKGSTDPKFLKAGPNGLPLETAAARNGARIPEAVAKDVAGSRTGTLRDAVADSPTDGHVGRVVADTPDGEVEVPVTYETFEKGRDTVLSPDEIREGVRVGESETFVDLTPQLRYVRETTVLEEMRVVGFIRREQVPRYRVTDSYYVGADVDEGGDPTVLALLLHGMKKTGRVAVVKWSKSGGRQAMGAIVPAAGGALTLLQLAWHDEVRQAPPRALTHTKVDVTESEVAAMCDLIDILATSGSDSLDSQQDDRKVEEATLVALAADGHVDAYDMPDVTPQEVPDLPLVDLVRRSADDARRSA